MSTAGGPGHMMHMHPLRGVQCGQAAQGQAARLGDAFLVRSGPCGPATRSTPWASLRRELGRHPPEEGPRVAPARGPRSLQRPMRRSAPFSDIYVMTRRGRSTSANWSGTGVLERLRRLGRDEEPGSILILAAIILPVIMT